MTTTTSTTEDGAIRVQVCADRLCIVTYCSSQHLVPDKVAQLQRLLAE